MSFNNGPTIVTNGLVLALDAGDKNSYVSGSTTWFDLTGVNNGTLTNGPTFNSGSGGSIVFDGVNDQVTFSIPTTNLPQITCDAWFKADTSNITGSLIAGWLMGVEEQFRIIYDLVGFNWVCKTSNTAWYGPGTSVYYNYSSSINNTWFNVTGVYNGSYNSMYLNGILQETGSVISGVVTLNNNFNIGRGVSNVAYQKGNGSIYKIYNRALSPQEVLQNYNATKGRFGLT
jgi:hypothetical protein